LQLKFPNARYVGSANCKSCHKEAYKIWEKSGHAHAYQTLEEARKPSLRQYDGECIVCHVVGFTNKTGFTDAQTTPKLKGVGCESCHGPGSPHLDDNYDTSIQELMNPYKTKLEETPVQKKQRTLRLDIFCQKCHDQDNDVNWSIDKWEKIIHMDGSKSEEKKSDEKTKR
jgi:hypothetical protein